MDTIHHRKGYASCQSTDYHDRHVGIESAIRMLVEFNIRRNRKPGIRAPQPYLVDHQPPVASAANKRTTTTSEFSIVHVPPFSLGSISGYPTLRLCSQFRQEFVDLATRKSGLIADTSQGHHYHVAVLYRVGSAL